MARTSVAKSAVEGVVTENIDATITAVEENLNEENKKNMKKTIKAEPLEDSDEIEVVSLIPNVSYKDFKTGDMYEWDKVGHVEYMTFDTLKNMMRTNRGYFRNMWLRPNDDRVVDRFGLAKTLEKYELLMDESNYNRKNVKALCDAISDAPNGLKISVCNKIKDLVASGKISDAIVIKALEEHLKIDLMSLL